MTVTFFGHKNTPEKEEQRIRSTIVDLIQNHGADKFYVGNEGKFDKMVAKVLKGVQKVSYTDFEYHVVLAYLPNVGETSEHPTKFPEGIEKTPKRYAIDFRNRWMIDKADTIVTYLTHGWGGAAKFVALAKRKNLRIINISGVDVKL